MLSCFKCSEDTFWFGYKCNTAAPVSLPMNIALTKFLMMTVFLEAFLAPNNLCDFPS